METGNSRAFDSEIFTGRLSAALDIITPRVFTDKLSVASIESSLDDGVVSLVLGDDGRFEIRTKADPEDSSATTSALVTFDAEGNAVFSGTISAGGFVFGGTSTTTSEETEDTPASFIESIGERVLNAIALIRSAAARSFAVVTLYTKNMFAAVITIVPEGRLAVPAGKDQIAGTGRIPAGETSVVVENSATLSTSKIFITPLSLAEHPLIVTLKRPGIGFTVSMIAPAALDIYFDWLIVDSYPTDDTTTSVPGETVIEDEPEEEVSEPPVEEPVTDEIAESSPAEEEPLTESEPEVVPETEPQVDEVLPQDPQGEPATEGEEETEAEPENEPEEETPGDASHEEPEPAPEQSEEL